MVPRYAKTALVAAVAFLLTIVVYNNLFDYHSNEQFVRHVLAMDTTFEGNRGMGRAITTPWIQTAVYWTIIAWEAASAALCWLGAVKLAGAAGSSAAAFRAAKPTAIAGLTLSLLQWLVAFLAVGGEWFLMWQSPRWNGQDAALRMFAVIGIVLVLLAGGDDD